MKYLVHEKWGGRPYDIKKTASNTDDDVMCWAAAASNILSWTGWGFPPTENFADENDIFSYFLNHWSDTAGYPMEAWKWWFDGLDQDGVESPGGGFWDPPYSLSQYYHVENDRAKALTAVRDFFNLGCGIVLDLVSQQGGHEITCWGYETDDEDRYLGIYTTDSDDPTQGLRYYELSQDISGTDEWAHYKDWWYFTYHNGYTRYLIGAVHALDRANHVLEQRKPNKPTGLRIV